MDECLLNGKAAVVPMRELVCLASVLGMPFSLVVPPNQKFPSNEAHKRGLKS